MRRKPSANNANGPLDPDTIGSGSDMNCLLSAIDKEARPDQARPKYVALTPGEATRDLPDGPTQHPADADPHACQPSAT